MEGYRTSAVVSGAGVTIRADQPLLSAPTAVPKEYTDEYEKNTSGCTNSDPPNDSFAQPSKIQFSHQFHKIQRLCPHEDPSPEPLSEPQQRWRSAHSRVINHEGGLTLTGGVHK